MNVSRKNGEDEKEKTKKRIKNSLIGLGGKECNEIDADTHGLPILCCSDRNAHIGEFFTEELKTFKDWESGQGEGTIIEKSKQWRFK